MTSSEFSNYILFAALAFGILGVVNLFRPHKRWLGVGSILFGVGAMLYREKLDMALVAVPCALAVLCIGLQARDRERRKA